MYLHNRPSCAPAKRFESDLIKPPAVLLSEPSGIHQGY